MSRWLKGLDQVSNLIEKLDDRVANVAEERADEQLDDVVEVGDILSMRGLVDTVDDDTDNEGHGEGEDTSTISPQNTKVPGQEILLPPKSDLNDPEIADNDAGAPETEKGVDDEKGEWKEGTAQPKDSQSGGIDEPSAVVEDEVSVQDALAPEPQKSHRVIRQEDGVTKPPTSNSKKAVAPSKEAQREIRTLRKHVVKMNESLVNVLYRLC